MTASVLDVTTALRRLAAACGETVLPGASEEELAGLVRRVADLGAVVPREHLALLRDQDGFEANGLRVFGTTRRRLAGGAELPALDEVALDLEGGELDDHLVLAQGSSAFWAVHRRTGACHELDVVPAQVLATHPGVPALLLAAVAAQS
ncbi:hypothetical protein [Actinomycetospora aeridis]|uniref:SMI1/KNR4 family protein n=1 Tax=Actinomycetospora aeridis TaxID=3129231 RepID=A0ABU8NBA8_9PSEU